MAESYRPSHIGEAFQQVRELQGRTRQDAARDAMVDVKTLEKVENGEVGNKGPQIATALGTTMQALQAMLLGFPVVAYNQPEALRVWLIHYAGEHTEPVRKRRSGTRR